MKTSMNISTRISHFHKTNLNKPLKVLKICVQSKLQFILFQFSHKLHWKLRHVHDFQITQTT